jgi:hypothetical protein
MRLFLGSRGFLKFYHLNYRFYLKKFFRPATLYWLWQELRVRNLI